MKAEKTINLTAYVVEYIDQREPKPRAVHHELCVLDGGRVSALLAALVAADRVGARWRVVPVFLGYPAFYNVRTLGPSGCMTPAPRELVAKLCAAVGAEQVEAVSVDCGRKIEEGGTR